MPIIGTEGGNNRPIKTVEIIGNSILSVSRYWPELFHHYLSFLGVVNNFNIGG